MPTQRGGAVRIHLAGVSVIIGLVAFGDVPTPYMIVGGLIVIGSGLFILYRERRLGLNREQRKVANRGAGTQTGDRRRPRAAGEDRNSLGRAAAVRAHGCRATRWCRLRRRRAVGGAARMVSGTTSSKSPG